jgi:ATP synthase protein I
MKEKSQIKKPLPNQYIKYSSIGFQMIGIIGVFTYAGIKLDQYQQNKTPIYTGLLSLLGVIISLYVIIKGLKSN